MDIGSSPKRIPYIKHMIEIHRDTNMRNEVCANEAENNTHQNG